MRSVRAFALGILGLMIAQNSSFAQSPTPASVPLATAAGRPDLDMASPAAQPGGLVAGVSLYVLKPYVQDNTAFTLTSGVGAANGSVVSQAFSWNFNAAPMVWFGYEFDNGVGVRARYFNFDSSSQTFTTGLTQAQAATSVIAPPASLQRLPGAAFQAPGILATAGFGADSLTFGSHLRIETYDLEFTYESRFNNLSLIYSAGGRYLHAIESYRGTLSNSTAVDPVTGLGATESQLLSYDHNFAGGGPTLAMQAEYLVGRSGLAIFASTRGSLLAGTTSDALLLNQTVRDPGVISGGNQNNNPRSIGTSERALPVLEAEAGFEYGMDMGAFHPFFRAAVVSQTYFELGNASSTRGNLSLFGMQFALGTNY